MISALQAIASGTICAVKAGKVLSDARRLVPGQSEDRLLGDPLYPLKWRGTGEGRRRPVFKIRHTGHLVVSSHFIRVEGACAHR